MRSHLQQEGAFADAWVAPHEHERGWDHAPAQNPGNFFTCICVEGDPPDCRTKRPAATRAVASSVSLLASPWGLQLQYTCQGGMLLSCALRGYHRGAGCQRCWSLEKPAAPSRLACSQSTHQRKPMQGTSSQMVHSRAPQGHCSF